MNHSAPKKSVELTPHQKQAAEKLEKEWKGQRWSGIRRDYTAEEVIGLRNSFDIEFTLARRGSELLWEQLHQQGHIATMGAYNGSQAVQMVRGGLKAIYVSGWQCAADANPTLNTFPDMNIYPSNSVPTVVKRLNNALIRADQIEHCEGARTVANWVVPLVADCDAGFGGPLHAFELMRTMIEAGASGVHFEDQLASEKKCGHLGGKVLVPTQTFIRTLTAARLAADVANVPTIIIARTDAESAQFMTSDIDPRDQAFLTGKRTPEGYFEVRKGFDACIARGLAYAPYADLIWAETSTPNLEDAKRFAEAIHKKYPGKLLAYNCSPSFNWKRELDDATIAKFQRELGAMGFKFQFITLAGWHSTNLGSWELAKGYAAEGMSAYVRLQEREFELEKAGYTATRHQHEVGTGYFDRILDAVTQKSSSTSALSTSTEAAQFARKAGKAS